MNINYNQLDAFSDSSVNDPIDPAKTLSDPFAEQNIEEAPTPLPDDTPYSPQIQLVSEYISDFKEKESAKDRGTEDIKLVDDIRDIFDDYKFGVVTNLGEIKQSSERRPLKVKVFDLAQPEQYTTDVLEEAKKAYDAGTGILMSKSGQGPFQVQTRAMVDLLKEHDINSVEAVMPDGETQTFRNVKFQVMTGSTSSALAKSFSQIAIVISTAREKERREQQEKRSEAENRHPSFNLNQLNLPKREEIPRDKRIFQLMFSPKEKAIRNVDTQIINEKKAAEDRKKQKDREDQDVERDFILKKEIGRGIGVNTQKQSKLTKEIEKGEQSKKNKEKVKLTPDSDVPPVGIVDNTRGKYRV